VGVKELFSKNPNSEVDDNICEEEEEEEKEKKSKRLKKLE